MKKNNKKIKINQNVDLSDVTLEEMTQVEQDLLVNLAKKKLASKMIEDAYKKHPDWPSPATMMPVRSTIGYTTLFGNYYLFYLTIPDLLDVLLVDNVFYDEKELKWKVKFKGIDIDCLNEAVGVFGDSISFRELYSKNDLYKLMFKFSFVKFPQSPVGLSPKEFEKFVYDYSASKPEIFKNSLSLIQVLEKELNYHGCNLGAAPFIKYEDIPVKLYNAMMENEASDIVNFSPRKVIFDLWRENPKNQLKEAVSFYDYIVDVHELPNDSYFDIRITSDIPMLTNFYWPHPCNRHRGYTQFLSNNSKRILKPKKITDKVLQKLSPIVKIKTYPSLRIKTVLESLDKGYEIDNFKVLINSYIKSLQQKGLIDKLQIEVTLEDMLEETLKEADFVEKVKSRNKTGLHVIKTQPKKRGMGYNKIYNK